MTIAWSSTSLSSVISRKTTNSRRVQTVPADGGFGIRFHHRPERVKLPLFRRVEMLTTQVLIVLTLNFPPHYSERITMWTVVRLVLPKDVLAVCPVTLAVYLKNDNFTGAWTLQNIRETPPESNRKTSSRMYRINPSRAFSLMRPGMDKE